MHFQRLLRPTLFLLFIIYFTLLFKESSKRKESVKLGERVKEAQDRERSIGIDINDTILVTKFGIDLKCLDKVREEVEKSSSISRIGKAFLDMWIHQTKKSMLEYDQNPFESYSPVIFKSGEQVWENGLSKSRCRANGSPSATSLTLPKVGLAVLTNGVVPNIQEWILYHLLIGFQKIIVFDDTEPESVLHKKLLATLQPFIDTGRVEMNQFGLAAASFPQGQFNNKVLEKYQESKELDWIAYFDMDEFLLLKDPKSWSSRFFSFLFGFTMSNESGLSCVDEFLVNYQNYGGVGVRWKMVSPHSVGLHDPNQTYTDQFKYSVYEPSNSRGKKVIIQVQHTTQMDVHHAKTTKPIVSPEYQTLGHNGGLFESFFAELRHFGQGDLTYAILNKACGASNERSMFQTRRIAQLLSNLEAGSVKGAKYLSEIDNTNVLGLDLLRSILTEAHATDSKH
jgi:hypothetical protein